jgi:hypothetical protein
VGKLVVAEQGFKAGFRVEPAGDAGVDLLTGLLVLLRGLIWGFLRGLLQGGVGRGFLGRERGGDQGESADRDVAMPPDGAGRPSAPWVHAQYEGNRFWGAERCERVRREVSGGVGLAGQLRVRFLKVLWLFPVGRPGGLPGRATGAERSRQLLVLHDIRVS